MGLLDRGQAMLNRSMKLAGGRPVLYTRAGVAVATLTVWIGSTVFQRNQMDPGAAVIWGDRDYLILVADLILGGSLSVPKVGDRITETIAGVATVFEIMPPDNNEPAWRLADQMRTAYRLHVKRVA